MVSGVDRLNRMTIRASSPDQQVQVTLSDGDNFAVAFQPGAYERYRERALEQQLTRLATGVWSGYRRGYLTVVSELTGQPVGVGQHTSDSQRRRFQEARARLVSTGESPKGLVRVESVGLVRWQIDIRDGALAGLTEQEFLAELNRAVRALLTDYYARMIKLKGAFFDLNLDGRDRWFGRHGR